MALTVTQLITIIKENIGLIANGDVLGSYRVGVEDVNSDEALVAQQAILLDTADIEIATEAINTALQAGGVTQLQLAALLTGITLAGTTITKTIQTELLAPTLVAANAQQLSAELDLANIKKATIYIDHGRTAVTAFVGAGTEYRIEGSQKATGNDTWRTIASVECIITLATAITADGNEAAGTTVIDIGANTPAVGDIVFWRNGTLALSEWMKVVAITGGTDFTIQDGLTNPQLAAQLIYNKAEQFVLTLDVNSLTRLRVVANNNNGTTNVGVVSRVAAITQE